MDEDVQLEFFEVEDVGHYVADYTDHIYFAVREVFNFLADLSAEIADFDDLKKKIYLQINLAWMQNRIEASIKELALASEIIDEIITEHEPEGPKSSFPYQFGDYPQVDPQITWTKSDLPGTPLESGFHYHMKSDKGYDC